ncbi:MAG: hypothetical protein IT480_12760 [Gammaproteobacteria bacterium]|nr:hypothetical protein [Gammaproteobacteria bacterium]
MKLSSVIASVEVRSLAGGVIEVRPKWLVSAGVLTRMAVANEIQRLLDKKLGGKRPRGKPTGRMHR